MAYYEEEENPPESQTYDIEPDDPFTKDQIEEIYQYKQKVQAKIDKNDAVLRGLETFFWGVTSYSLCRLLVLSLGLSGINLAIALSLVLNQIVNRDCLDAINIERREGQWEVKGMGKFFKFSFGLVTSAFILWTSIGEVISFQRQSEQTYEVLQSKVEEFNRLPEQKQVDLLEKGLIALSVGVGLLIILQLKGGSQR
jgi:hypothetical protein